MRVTISIAVALTIFFGFALSEVVVAQEGSGCGGSNCIDSQPNEGSVIGASATEFVAGSGGGARRVGGSGDPDSCDWVYFAEGDPFSEEMPLALGQLGPEARLTENVWLVKCPGFPINRVVLAGERPPAAVVDGLIREARDSTPVVAFEPAMAPSGSVDAPMVAQLRTWLWVDEADWVPVSATASVPILSVTTTATPVRAVWRGGDDPEVVTCYGPGKAYLFDVPEDRQNQDCTTVFKHSSAVRDYEVDLSVTWQVEFECSAFCGSGRLPDIETTSTTPVTVAEVQALVTCNTSDCR